VSDPRGETSGGVTLLAGVGEAVGVGPYTRGTRLVNELVEAADDKTLARTIDRYGRVDMLMIDELGYMELDRRGAELERTRQKLP
jgi:hypothetical protein